MTCRTRSVHELLLTGHATVSVAESCTGGLISELLTDAAGSSAYFLMGLVVYSNRAKTSLLGVRPLLIKSKGAVSREVAQAMARAVRRRSGADLGIGVTGIAGPSGGTKAKPVGTVFIAAADSRRVLCRKFLFRGSRAQVRKKAACAALSLLARLARMDR